MNCEEAHEWITALVDDELSAEERVAIQTHLDACPQCRQAYAQEGRLKQEIRLASAAVTAPLSLRQAVAETYGNVDRRRPIRARLNDFLQRPLVRPALVLALLLLAASPLMFRSAAEKNIALETLSIQAEITAGKTIPTRTADPNELKRQLVQAVNGRFTPMGFDLSAMKLHPVSGFMQKFGGREILVTVYQGDGSSVTCFTFLGSESDAPADAEKFVDAAKKINYYLFAGNDLHAVMHKEGEVICIMVSEMPAADLLALVRQKARHS